MLSEMNKMLKPIREDLAEVKKNVAKVEKNVAVVEKNLAEVKRVQETQVLPSVVATEQTLKGYADMYKINDENVKKLDKRLNIVEEELSIEPPPELTLGQVK